MAWMFVSPPKFMLNLNLQCDSLLDVACRRWVGAEGASFLDGVGAFYYMRTQCSSPLQDAAIRPHLGKQRATITRHQTCWCLDLELSRYLNYK
jgi:hypothetical protein